MIIKNAAVFQEDGSFRIEDIFILNDRIVNSKDYYNASSKDEVLDAQGMYAIPGLTDIHFHGCFGHDFCEGTEKAFDAITAYEASQGITTLCPATMTLPEETLAEIVRNFSDYPNDKGAIFCGINLEGPFLSVKKKGAQREDYLRKPDVSMFLRLQELSGNRIKLVSIAPEEEGALDFIAALKTKVVVSVAHTTINYEKAIEAFERGARHVTHLFNAMPPFLHRDPGVIGAAFDTPDCRVELICDGVHIHSSVIRAVFQMFGRDRVVMISDSMMATGIEDGIYTLGEQDVRVEGKVARLTTDGTIACSVTNLMDCLRYTVLEAGIPLETAVYAAAVNPAKVIGIDKDYGSIAVGKVANIVLLDKKLNTSAVILKGNVI